MLGFKDARLGVLDLDLSLRQMVSLADLITRFCETVVRLFRLDSVLSTITATTRRSLSSGFTKTTEKNRARPPQTKVRSARREVVTTDLKIFAHVIITI